MTDTSQTDHSDLDTSKSAADDGVNYEALASAMGWRPESEFKGPKEHFLDAKTYYERGQAILPVVRAEAQALRDEIDRIKADAKQALQVSERAREREVADLKAQLEAAKLARKDAIKEADGDTFEAADTQVKELETAIAEASKKPPQDEAPKVDPNYVAWLDRPEQSWFKGDEEAQAMAEGLVRLPKYKGLIGQREKLWDAVVGDIKKMRDAAKRESRADLNRDGPEGAGRGNGEVRARAGERSYSNLTNEFKQQCDRQYKSFGITIPIEKWRERYVQGCSPDSFRK